MAALAALLAGGLPLPALADPMAEIVGRWRDSDSVAPGNDPMPPRDKWGPPATDAELGLLPA